MPDNYEYDATDPNKPKFIAMDDDTITIGDHLRLRLKGVEVTNTEIRAVGDITPDRMGKISA